MPSNPESFNESHDSENELLTKRNAIINAVEEAKQRIREDFAVEPGYFAQLISDAYEASVHEVLSKQQVEAMTDVIRAAGSSQQQISGVEVADAIFDE